MKADADDYAAAKRVELGGSPIARRALDHVTVAAFIDEHARTRTGPKGRRLAPKTVALHVEALTRFAAFVGPDTRLDRITKVDAVRFSTTYAGR